MTKAREMLEIADAYEAGLQKMIACGYEEYGPEPQRKHRLIIEALRLAAQAGAPAILPQRMRDAVIEECAKHLEACGFRYSNGFDVPENLRRLKDSAHTRPECGAEK